MKKITVGNCISGKNYLDNDFEIFLPNVYLHGELTELAGSDLCNVNKDTFNILDKFLRSNSEQKKITVFFVHDKIRKPCVLFVWKVKDLPIELKTLNDKDFHLFGLAVLSTDKKGLLDASKYQKYKSKVL